MHAFVKQCLEDAKGLSEKLKTRSIHVEYPPFTFFPILPTPSSRQNCSQVWQVYVACEN